MPDAEVPVPLTAPGPAWDVTTDPANPQPLVWPVCPTCLVPWVWRRALNFGTGRTQWLWFRDCKHKAPAVLATGTSDE